MTILYRWSEYVQSGPLTRAVSLQVDSGMCKLPGLADELPDPIIIAIPIKGSAFQIRYHA